MAVYTSPTLDASYTWNLNTDSWSRSTSSTPQVQDSTIRRTVLLPPFPAGQGADVTAATLHMEAASSLYGGQVRAWVGLTGDLPANPDGQTIDARPATGYVQENLSYTGTTWDLTDLVRQAMGDASRTAGAPLAILLYTTSSSTVALRLSSVVLTVDYASEQFLDPPAPVAATATLPALGARRALSPVVVDATAALPTLSVVGPRQIAPVTAPATAALPAPGVSGTGDAPALTVATPVPAATTLPAPSIVVTIPPPEPPAPWERVITDPAYLAALVDTHITTDARAEIISPDDTVLATLGGTDPTHPGMLDGTVTCDGSASIRWTCDLTLDNPDLLPDTPADLLHPLAHNRVRLWWRILVEGVWQEIPVGTYFMEEDPRSDDGQISSRFLGSDAVAQIKLARWDTALDLTGMTISEAITAIIDNRAPWVRTAIAATDEGVPEAYEPGEPGSDPWEDVQSLAHAADMIAYADRMGTIRVEPRPTPGQAVADFSEGEHSALVSLPKVEVPAEMYNVVTVVSADPDVDPPVTGRWSEDDASSPLWVGHGYLYTHRVENGIIRTEQQANAMARNIGVDHSPTITVDATVLPHPHLDPGDTITINRAGVGVTGDYQVTAWTLGLAPGQVQTITATTRRGRAWAAMA